MEDIITKINREQGFVYRVDGQGNVVKSDYNWLKDPWTLVAICIIVLGSIFYLQMHQSLTNEANFEDACLLYTQLRGYWIGQHPGKIPTLEQIFELKVDGLGNIINQAK